MSEDAGWRPSSSTSSSTAVPGITPREWAVLWGLFTAHDPLLQELLCAELLQLPPAHINRYLLQYVYMAVARPCGALERTVTQLCGRSFQVAVQVSWLLLALLQDQPGNQHIRLFKDACERAALTGNWMSPFEQAAQQLPDQPQDLLTQQQEPPAQQPQQEEQQWQQQQQRQEKQQWDPQPEQPAPQQQQDGRSVSPLPHMIHSRSSPAATGTATAAAAGGGHPSTPLSPGSSSSPGGLTAFSSRSSLDLAHKSSIDLAHRFRNSLDLELMRHASSRDLAQAGPGSGPGAAAAGGPGRQVPVGSPSGIGAGLGSRSRPASAKSTDGAAGPSPLSRPSSAAAAAGSGAEAAGSSQHTQQAPAQEQQHGQHGLPLVRTRPQAHPAAGTAAAAAAAATAAAATAAGGVQAAHSSHLYSSNAGDATAAIAAADTAASSTGDTTTTTSSSGDAADASSSQGWGAVPGSVAAGYSSFAAYLSARRQELEAALGPGEGVSGLLEASHEVAQGNGPEGIGWLVSHEEELSDFLSMSALLSQPARSPAHAAARDSYLATLDFVEALCETSSNLTRFPPADRKRVLQHCLARISQEVEAAAAQGVAVRCPLGGCAGRVLRLLVQEAAILNSRDKAPFLLLLETQADDPPPPQSAATSSAAAAAAAVGRAGVPSRDALNASTASEASNSTPTAAAGQPQPQLDQSAGSSRAGARQPQQQLGRPQSPHKASPLSRSSQGGVGSSHGCSGGVASQPHPAAPDSRSSRHSGAAGTNQQQQRPGSPSLQRPASPLLQRPSSPQLFQQQQQRPGSPRLQQQQQQQQQCDGFEQQGGPLLQRSCPSLLEMQMQEAAALLRGEPAAKLVRVHICIDGARQQQQQGAPMALLSRQQQWEQQQQQPQAGTDAQGRQEGECEPWVFGEVPAAAAAAAAARGSSPSGAAASSSSGRGPVRLVIEVVAPAVPGLVLPQAQKQKQRRRLPSMEAIDIIAGKLGKAALPLPADIGPPLHPDTPSASSSRRASSEADAAAEGLGPAAALVASSSSDGGAGSTSSSSGGGHMPPVLEGVPAAPGGNATPEGWLHVKTPAAPAAAAAAAAGPSQASTAAAGAAGLSAASGRVSSSSGSQQQQQQQQVPSSPQGLWGRLLSMGRQQQQQVPPPPSPQSSLRARRVSSHSQQQQQQQQVWSAADEAEAAAERSRRAAAVFGERWSKTCARTAAASPYGQAPGWELRGAIIKSGDDCRQELLALQLIRELQDIWAAAGLPLWVRPFDVLVTSADTALIELIPDAISVHSIKSRTRQSSSSGDARSSSAGGGGGGGAAASAGAGGAPASSSEGPQGKGSDPQQQQGKGQRAAGGPGAPRARHSYSGAGSSSGALLVQQPQQPPSPSLSVASGSGSSQASLADFFFARWQRGSAECLAAQRRFVESLAGYSLATYFLQVKDRHNGNIMMDASGRLIHIDFGFMLSNTPGGGWVRFEAAPMKLTRELLEVMDSDSEGQPSVLFDYFKVLCIQGFLAARKERHRLVGLVRIMADCCKPRSPGTPPPTPLAAAAAAAGGGGEGILSPTAGPAPVGSSSGSSRRGSAGGGSSSGQQAAAAAVAAAAGTGAASWPCFRAGGDRVVAALEARFAPSLSEAACVQHVLRLISTSLDAWSTRTYDYYQLVLNGIL